MSYYNPKVYNKQNLKEADRKELDYYYEKIFACIDNVVEDHYEYSNIEELKKVEQNVIHKFCEELKDYIGYDWQEDVVSIIDEYEDEYEIQEVENPETYHYKGE